MAPPQSSSTSSSITIPHHLHQSSPSGPSNPTPAPATRRALHRSVFSTSTEASSSSSSSLFSSSSSPKMPQEIRDIKKATPPSSSPPEMTTQKREKDVASASGSGPLVAHQRRPSLLSPSLSQSSIHRSINLAPPDSPPRLVTFLQSSQGFTWNDELFLPSYHSELTRRRRRYDGGSGGAGGMEEEADKIDVIDILVSEEEARGMVPE